MKIGFNVRKIKEMILSIINQELKYLADQVYELEKKLNDNDWIEITATDGQKARITKPFTEIRLLAKCSSANYSVTYNFDNTIFHNSYGTEPTYLICGNPTENNFGCKFKYMVTGTNKQYVTVDSCFNGGTNDTFEFRAWIKPDSSINSPM